MENDVYCKKNLLQISFKYQTVYSITLHVIVYSGASTVQWFLYKLQTFHLSNRAYECAAVILEKQSDNQNVQARL